MTESDAQTRRARRPRQPMTPLGNKAAGRAPKVKKDHATRARVIEAALQAILELGFYRTSTIAIAERAGVTWGVIQYHFGSREKLMVAVLEEGNQRLATRLRSASISADDLTGRIHQYLDIMASHYASVENLAFVQVLLNLSHDPETSEQTHDLMIEIAKIAEIELTRLMSEVLVGTDLRSADVKTLTFHAARGLATSQGLNLAAPSMPQLSARQLRGQRTMMARALTLLIEEVVENGN